MKNEKPLILISNDDGVSAKGLRVLVETLSGLGEIVNAGCCVRSSYTSLALAEKYDISKTSLKNCFNTT